MSDLGHNCLEFFSYDHLNIFLAFRGLCGLQFEARFLFMERDVTYCRCPIGFAPFHTSCGPVPFLFFKWKIKCTGISLNLAWVREDQSLHLCFSGHAYPLGIYSSPLLTSLEETNGPEER